MKATELSIGDWIYRPACVDKITSITTHSIVGLDPLRGSISLSEVKPIKITGKILERNDWEYVDTDEDGARHYEWGDGKTCFMEWWEKGSAESALLSYGQGQTVIIREIPVNTVHELQHVMKLCGFVKEVDDFVID